MDRAFMSEARLDTPGAFERTRKIVSRLALTVFAASFVVLLVASATPYWTPQNEWLVLCDQLWRVSGLAALVLGLVPPARRAFQTLGGWLGLDRAS
jgi:hypothetical protein